METSYRDMLLTYVPIVRRMGIRAESFALTTQSSKFRDILAAVSTTENLTVEELSEKVDSLDNNEVNYPWLGALGRVIALQDLHPGDATLGLKFLEIACRNLPKDSANLRFHKLEVELLVECGHFDRARMQLSKNALLQSLFHDYISVDLKNPFLTGEVSTMGPWLNGFNLPLLEANRIPVKIIDLPGPPFDRLSTEKPITVGAHGPKVSVIMTSYAPEKVAFQTAVRSILNQTWVNIELIIVDDATPGRSIEFLEGFVKSDSRVKLLLLNENAGTYLARNAGLEAATGFYVTGQDSDDWSHPERIEKQVQYMLNNADAAGVVTSAIRTDENLVRVARGLNPGRKCEVSFLTKTDTARNVGGYLPARKAADSEFRQRVEFNTERDIGIIDEPLYFIRMMPNSLSRGDFRPGWSHHSRRAFWNATTYWHTQTAPTDLIITGDTNYQLPIPRRFQVTAPPRRELDVVFVSDWRSDGGMQRAMIDEISLLTSQGLAVGILQTESVHSSAGAGSRPIMDIQRLINEGIVAHVIPDEGAKIRLIILRDPTIMQFPTTQQCTLEVETVMILADTAADTKDGSHVFYRKQDCEVNAKAYFNANIIWKNYRQKSSKHDDENELSDNTLAPRVIDASSWSATRDLSARRPVIVGRHAFNLETNWPADREDLENAWPTEGGTEVRIFGDARGALRILKKRYYPLNWVVFKDSQISPRAFMHSIDYFVYYPNEDMFEDFCREAWEAAASGCIVILPTQFEKLHGATAIYSDIDKISEVIDSFESDKSAKIKQSLSAIAEVSNIKYGDVFMCSIKKAMNIPEYRTKD